MSSVPTSRPVHPCITTATSQGSRGVEIATWAYWTHPRQGRNATTTKNHQLPNLIAASAHTLQVYTVRSVAPTTATTTAPHKTEASTTTTNNNSSPLQLVWKETYQLAGEIIHVVTLPSPDPTQRDALLIALGGGGAPRWTVVSYTDGLGTTSFAGGSSTMQTDIMLDFTTIVQEHAQGAVTPLEYDAILAVSAPSILGSHSYPQIPSNGSKGDIYHDESDNSITTVRPGQVLVASVLGGGVAVVVVALTWTRLPSRGHHGMGVWRVTTNPPFVLPLQTLARSLPYAQKHNPQQFSHHHHHANSSTAASSAAALWNSLTTGWGDIVSMTFLTGYREPVLVLLHTDPSGAAWTTTSHAANVTSSSTSFTATMVSSSTATSGWYVTALSLQVLDGSTTPTRRAAWLWSVSVGYDAQTVLAAPSPPTACVVVGVNSITTIVQGRIVSVVATNGWARHPFYAQPNPHLSLSLSLDGCAFTWLTDTTAMVVLRHGAVYLWQPVHSSPWFANGHTTRNAARDTSSRDASQWALWPTGHTLGSMGHIATLLALPISTLNLASASGPLWDPIAKSTTKNNHTWIYGILLAGSRLGDSLFMAYALERTSQIVPTDDGIASMLKTESGMNEWNMESVKPTDDFERMLLEEEEALYDKRGDIVPPSSEEDEDEDTWQSGSGPARPKQARRNEYTVLRALIPMDVLVNLGPLGPVTEGPIARSPDGRGLPSNTNVVWPMSQEPRLGATSHVYPCGFGSSGGLALVTVPGRDDRYILAEEDCLNVEAIFSLPKNRLMLLGMSGAGIKVMRLKASVNGGTIDALEEVDVASWCSIENVEGELSSAQHVFSCKLLTAGEWNDGNISLLVSESNEDGIYYYLVTLDVSGEAVTIVRQFLIEEETGGSSLIKTTSFSHREDIVGDSMSFACCWSSGSASFINFTQSNVVQNITLTDDTVVIDEMEVEEENQTDKELKLYYQSRRIVAIDVFKAPMSLFEGRGATDLVATGEPVTSNGTVDVVRDDYFDEDDEELYGGAAYPSSSNYAVSFTNNDQQDLDREATYFAICRQNGSLEVYSTVNMDVYCSPCYVIEGLASGEQILHPKANASSNAKQPKSHKVCIQELCFFLCGTTKSDLFGTTAFCLAAETSDGDLRLYLARLSDDQSHPVYFQKLSLHIVARPSQEQGRHRTKLTRKGIVSDPKNGPQDVFTYCKLHRFSNISGQDGLFAALSTPAWIIAERGKPTWLYHRTRHAAPAGGKLQPVTGFCASIGLDATLAGAVNGFVTLHERVGRVGSKRLTLFSGLAQNPSTSLSTSSFSLTEISPGGGVCAEKITLGVTVRRIQFIDDPEISTGEHPLYAVLVSREIEVDQSELNDDGLTEEERRRIKAEKEAEKIRRQVEADLGGFDIESEWVEEIQREDTFIIDMKLGGTPPLPKQQYSLWIVDAAENWAVIDSIDLEEDEHGITLQVMPLTDFPQEPGSNNEDYLEYDLESQTFIAIGTGFVDHNGEDVASHGRALLFEVKRPVGAARLISTQVAELSLVYVKEIFHGPVTSMTCISTEDRHRLIIGAGADGTYSCEFANESVYS
jgi:hypothetical protein